MATLTILTQGGRELLTLREDPASPRVLLGVPRKALRETLLQGVKEDVVFGETCTGYGTQNGRIVVTFASGKDVVADLVVACDGVNSVIRKQMIGDARHYLGIASMQGKCPMAPSIPALDSGPVMALGSGSSLFMLKDVEGVGWSLTTRAPEKEFDGLCHAALKEHAIAATRGWASAFERVVSESDPSDLLSLGGFYDRNPLAKAHTDGVVLLGDAAHPMSPFRGEGANTAMQDALVLADALAKSEANLEVALSSYRARDAQPKPQVCPSLAELGSRDAQHELVDATHAQCQVPDRGFLHEAPSTSKGLTPGGQGVIVSPEQLQDDLLEVVSNE